MKQIVRATLTLLAVLLMTACGGPDHKDPKSVADAALQCYVNEDFEGLKKLMNPNDKEKQEGVDKFIKMINGLKEMGVGSKHDKEKVPFESYSIKWMKDPFGYPLNDNTKELEVLYKTSEGSRRTINLEKIDGKWYLESIPLM